MYILNRIAWTIALLRGLSIYLKNEAFYTWAIAIYHRPLMGVLEPPGFGLDELML
jgi:hypothetical protein